MIQLINRVIREIINGKAVINSRSIYGYGLWVTITIYGYNKELTSYPSINVYGYKLYLVRAIGQYLANLGIQIKVSCRLIRAPILTTMLIHQLHGTTRSNSLYFMNKALMPNYYNCYFNHYQGILLLYMPIKRNGISLHGKASKLDSKHVQLAYNSYMLNQPLHITNQFRARAKNSLSPILIQSYTVTKLGSIGLRTTFK